MDVTFFSFWSVSDETPLTVALLVGVLLLVVGALLLFLPRSERRSKKSVHVGRSQSAPTVLPGYRIRSEQTKVPRQFLSVPRIAVLDAQRRGQPTMPPGPLVSMDAPTIAAETQDRPALLSDEPTLLVAPASETDQPENRPEQAWDEEADQITITLMPPQPPASTASAAPEALASTGLEAADEETLVEPAVPIPEAIDSPPLEAQHAPTEMLPDATTNAFPRSKELEELATREESEVIASEEEAPIVSAPPPAAPQQEAPMQPPIRKARLSNLFSESATERSFTKDAPPLAQPTPPPEPPQSAARRARLAGFPHPSTRIDDAVVAKGTEEESEQTPTGAVSASQASEVATALGSAATVERERSPLKLSQSGESRPSPEPPEAPPMLRVVCFGTVDILANGKPLSPLDSRFRSSREFELMAFLAYSAAMRRQAFVDRSAITEALLPEEMEDDVADESTEESEESFANRRSPLGGWKYRLCRRLRSQGIPDHAWLESRADGALRLRPEVQIDLIEFLQVSSHLRKARDQMRRPDGKQPERDDVFAWLQQLRHLHRDRGEFAEQFQLQEWTQEPRRRYRNIYWHALFYAAELLVALEERQTAIQLAEELVEQEEVETEVVYEALLTWLYEDGNKTDLLRWLNKYRAWYAAFHDGRSLDMARPDLLARLTIGMPPKSSS